MKLTIKNDGRKYNLKTLQEELGKEFIITQEPHTLCLPDGIQYFDLEIEVEEDESMTASYQAICDAHAPAETEMEAILSETKAKEVQKIREEIDCYLTELFEKPEFTDMIKAKINEV